MVISRQWLLHDIDKPIRSEAVLHPPLTTSATEDRRPKGALALSKDIERRVVEVGPTAKGESKGL